MSVVLRYIAILRFDIVRWSMPVRINVQGLTLLSASICYAPVKVVLNFKKLLCGYEFSVRKQYGHCSMVYDLIVLSTSCPVTVVQCYYYCTIHTVVQ
jgi:hypothetical protein